MTDLDKINPKFARPNTFCANSAVLPLLLATCSMFLAIGAAPNVEVFKNPLFVLCIIICGFSIILFVIPRIFKWNWEAKYFGFSVICVGSVALIGGIPWGSILLYSTLPIGLRVVGFLSYCSIIIFWAGRFVMVYRSILGFEKDRQHIYVECDGLIYYRQKVDVKILETELKFRQFPSAIVVIIFLCGAFLTVPYSEYLTSEIGLPFTHIFLAIAAVPTDMMAIGLMTRGLIIFYFHPWKLYKRSGRRVFVDLASK